MEVIVKKLFLALILIASLKLKAADAAQIAQPTQIIKVRTSDGIPFNLPFPTPFGTINNLIESLGNDGD